MMQHLGWVWGRGRFLAIAAGVLALSIGAQVDACHYCGRACVTSYQTVTKTVYVPTMVPEKRVVCTTQYRCEERERPITVQRCVPETKQVRQTVTVMVPEVRYRTVTCRVPVPVWDEVEQPYTVCVPYQEKVQGVRTVYRPVQVQEMRTVCRDEGHWETVTTYRRAHLGCLARIAYGGCAPVVCCTALVWVPNIVTEQVPVTVCKYELVQEPCEYTVTKYRTEQRVRRARVCRTEYREEQRQVPYTVCVPQQRECVRNVTTYKVLTEQRTQKYTVMIPEQVQKEVTVMVCRMVPKQVCVKVPVVCGCCARCRH